jgi:hypothetical protein
MPYIVYCFLIGCTNNINNNILSSKLLNHLSLSDSLIPLELRKWETKGYNIDSMKYFYFLDADNNHLHEYVIISKSNTLEYCLKVKRGNYLVENLKIEKIKLDFEGKNKVSEFVSLWCNISFEKNKKKSISVAYLAYVENDSLLFHGSDNLTEKQLYEIYEQLRLLP